MPDMMVMSLVAVVTSRTGKIIKNGLGSLLKEEKICYIMAHFLS